MKTDLTTEKYPLSPMQQGMLFHNLSASGSGVDVEQIFCTLHENVDDKAFERAWRRVIERHAILRTSFEWQGQAGPLQKVLSQAELEFLRQDWRNIDGAGRKNLFEELLESERKRGFDPARAPLMRLALLHTSEHEWRFLWTFHHLLLDGRAVVMVLNEVFAFYEAFQQGEDMKLPPPCSFRDFVERINQYDADKAEKAEKFWRKTLKGFTAPTPLT
ncbi:MAG: non-ribosomal peptide synthetase, partial [Verrucomicrobia bacterium]|nr:non-ribosomal peptide synthetase [Verrucomicrobiota bacterium]